MFGCESEPATRDSRRNRCANAGSDAWNAAELLQRHEAVEIGLAGEIDHRHPAPADLPQDLVAADRLQHFRHQDAAITVVCPGNVTRRPVRDRRDAVRRHQPCAQHRGLALDDHLRRRRHRQGTRRPSTARVGVAGVGRFGQPGMIGVPGMSVARSAGTPPMFTTICFGTSFATPPWCGHVMTALLLQIGGTVFPCAGPARSIATPPRLGNSRQAPVKLFVLDPHTIYRRGLWHRLELMPEVDAWGTRGRVARGAPDPGLADADLVILDPAAEGGGEFIGAASRARDGLLVRRAPRSRCSPRCRPARSATCARTR